MRDRGAAVFFGMCFVLVMFAVSVATVIIAREGFGTNGAAWVQAGGSIAAIAGAMWLFRSETTRRRRERRALGEEIAWAVRFALTSAQLEVRTTAFEVADDHLLDKENPKRHWLIRSKNCQNVLEVYAKRTDHIHPVLNQISSNGVLLLRQFDEDVQQAASFIERGERPSLNVASDIARYGDHFEQLIQMLDARMRGILIALDKGGDSLPVRDFEAWGKPEELSERGADEAKPKIRS